MPASVPPPETARPQRPRSLSDQARGASFSGQDLRGRDFDAADLRGADLSGASLVDAHFRRADLRGADFSRADLRGADLLGARLGLRPLATIAILGSAMLIAAAAGVVIGLAADALRERVTSPESADALSGLLALLLLLVFLAAFLARGIRTALRAFFISLAILVVAGWLVGTVYMGAYRPEVALQLVALMLVVALTLVVGLFGRIVAGTWGGGAIMVVALGAGVVTGGAGGGVGALAVSVLLVVLAKRGLADPTGDRPIHRLAYRVVRRHGTRFIGADLRGADFSGTRVAHADMREALTDGVIFGTEAETTSHHQPPTDDGPTGSAEKTARPEQVDQADRSGSS